MSSPVLIAFANAVLHCSTVAEVIRVLDEACKNRRKGIGKTGGRAGVATLAQREAPDGSPDDIWLAEKEAWEVSLKHIIELLDELIEAANEADAVLRSQPLPLRDPSHGKVHKLQDSLRIQLMGPLPFERVKVDIIDPALLRPGITEGARIAVEHVCNFIREGSLAGHKRTTTPTTRSFAATSIPRSLNRLPPIT
jgi:hypothetical protein